MFSRLIIFITCIITLCITGTHIIYADLPRIGHPGRVDEKSVISAIHKANEISKLHSEFIAAMNKYVEKEAACEAMSGAAAKQGCSGELQEILKIVKDILSRLNEQAHAVESEIALNRKNVDKAHSEKLDRILTSIIKTRQSANQRLRQTVKSI